MTIKTLESVDRFDLEQDIMKCWHVTDDLDVRGRIFDGAGTDIDILDNLSVSVDLTIWDSDVYFGINDAVVFTHAA